MVCGFVRLTRIALVYEFDSVFFLIELDFFFIFFHIVTKIVSKKIYVIKFYKVHRPIHKFDRLTWFMGQTSLTFLN
jgi:hypothetical protein